MSEILRMVVVLSLITGFCSAALTSANVLLSPQMDKQTDFYVRGPALERLFGKPAEELLSNKVTIRTEGGNVPVFFTREGDAVSTLAVEAVGKGGYGGDLKILVGIDLAKNSQIGMEVVSHSETPGLGARIEEPGFRGQWKGLSLDKPAALTANGGTIDAISGATNTSRAAVNGTNDVIGFIQEHRDEVLRLIAEM